MPSYGQHIPRFSAYGPLDLTSPTAYNKLEKFRLLLKQDPQ
jgi:hypothetical protein